MQLTVSLHHQMIFIIKGQLAIQKRSNFKQLAAYCVTVTDIYCSTVSSFNSAAGGGRSVTKKARTAAMAKDDLDDDDDDLTADMDDPAPENPISEVKLTAANAGRADMQPSKPGEKKLYLTSKGVIHL